jgi:hypothetical protein
MKLLKIVIIFLRILNIILRDTLLFFFKQRTPTTCLSDLQRELEG